MNTSKHKTLRKSIFIVQMRLLPMLQLSFKWFFFLLCFTWWCPIPGEIRRKKYRVILNFHRNQSMICNVDIINHIQSISGSSTSSVGRSMSWIFSPKVNTAYDRRFPKPSVLLSGYMFWIICYLVFCSFKVNIFWLFCSIIRMWSYSIYAGCVFMFPQ
jgi:hypothetical protein